MTNPHLKESIGRAHLCLGYVLFALVWFALSLVVRAAGDDRSNTNLGFLSLANNTIGTQNTAIGYQVLAHNTQGSWNTATGADALLSNSKGIANTGVGFGALRSNVNGSRNTANGFLALRNSTGADKNTAIGSFALENDTVGTDNVAVGFEAGHNITTGEENIDIGNRGRAGDSATIRIGDNDQTRTFIAGIREATVSGAAVFVNDEGQLGTVPSSQRFKKGIKAMDKVSEAILGLKPVTFRYKEEVDREGTPQFGLVAEEVEKVNPDLVVRDKEGKPYTVRYDAINAMLLNEFLKEHKAFAEQQRKLEQQGAMIARQQKQIEALTAGLQKVSTQLAAARPSLADLR